MAKGRTGRDGRESNRASDRVSGDKYNRAKFLQRGKSVPGNGPRKATKPFKGAR